MAEVDVDEILRNAAENEVSYKTTEVKKALELNIDLGNLLATDPNVNDAAKFRVSKEDYFKNLARDNMQILVNKIWELPIERYQDAVVAKMPTPTTVIPREKPVPKPKPPTKWEEYARAKGITKTKKSKKVWDETAKVWKPRWGYKRGNDDTKDWIVEVPQNADPMEDQFEKRIQAKKERVTKNEFQRLRNIAKAKKVKIPGVGVTPTELNNKDQVSKALSLAKKATASVGKFTSTLKNEKPPKNLGKKRKFNPLIGNLKDEEKKNLDILKKMDSRKPELDLNKAVSQRMFTNDEGSGKQGKSKTFKNSKRKVKKNSNNNSNTQKKGIGGNFKKKKVSFAK